MWGIVTRLWARKSGWNFSSVQMIFISTYHLAWFKGPSSLIFSGYQEFSLWLKSGCSIRNLTTHLHLELQLKIAVKLFLHVRATFKSTRTLQLSLYWLCACKGTQHSSLCNGKPRIRDHSMTQHIVVLWDR